MMTLISDQELRRAMEYALIPFGMSAPHVSFVVETLVQTSLKGIDTHGIRLFEVYVKELKGGRSNPQPRFTIHASLPAVSVLDADNALGVVAGNEAIDIAITRARSYGISAIAVKNSNHFGAAGHYTTRAAEQDMLALAFSNSDALVSPHIGVEALNGTNPLSMAVRGTTSDFFCLDMATSQVSYSKVMQYLQAGTPLESGWARDQNGNDSSHNGEMSSLQPLGGYKGQGLGMMVQILSALLTNMPPDNQISHLYGDTYDSPRRIGHLFICIDLRCFGDVNAIRSRVSSLLDVFRNSRSANSEAVIAPGDKERAIHAQRLHAGIPLSAAELRFFKPYLEAVANATSND